MVASHMFALHSHWYDASLNHPDDTTQQSQVVQEHVCSVALPVPEEMYA